MPHALADLRDLDHSAPRAGRTPWASDAASWAEAVRPPLESSLTTEVVVVGAGIGGLTTALLLAEAGREVVVIDAGPIADSGQTGLSSAHLSAAIDDRYHRLRRWHSASGARLAAESHLAAIAFIATRVKEHGIACGFRAVNGWLVPHVPKAVRELHAEAEAAREAGLEVELVPEAPGLVGVHGPALRFSGMAEIDPCAYMAGLARAAAARGVRIHPHSLVVDVHPGELHRLRLANDVELMAREMVLASNGPIHRLGPWLKLSPHRSYVIAAELPVEALPAGLLWDTATPYHYVRGVRASDGGALVIVGGEDHITGRGPSSADGPYARLESWLRRHLPAAGAVVRRWSGQINETPDGLAYLGLDPAVPRTYLITGDSGHGLTHGTIGAQIIAEQIDGRLHPWAELYRPGRLGVRHLPACAVRNLGNAVQYRDWLLPGAAAADIPYGAGAVVRQGASLTAVHRHPDGCVSACRATCTHMGGAVRWNPAEGTWDCPAHGSRFAADGALVHGPALQDLAPIEPPAMEPACNALLA